MMWNFNVIIECKTRGRRADSAQFDTTAMRLTARLARQLRWREPLSPLYSHPRPVRICRVEGSPTLSFSLYYCNAIYQHPASSLYQRTQTPLLLLPPPPHRTTAIYLVSSILSFSYSFLSFVFALRLRSHWDRTKLVTRALFSIYKFSSSYSNAGSVQVNYFM